MNHNLKTLWRKLLWKFKLLLRLRERLGNSEILILGDSHANIFHNPMALIPGYWYRVVAIGGATISGLSNPNSATKAIPAFRKAIRRYRGKICVTLLGEVDTGFVIWHRAEKHGISIEDTLDQTVSRYIDFIKSIPDEKSVVIISAPLPTIQDGQDWGEVANARKDVSATQLERTKLTLELNRRMQAFAKQSGSWFVDLDADSLGENGLVKPSLLRSDRNNHHYDPQAFLKILKPKLSSCIAEISVKVSQ